MLLGLIVSRTEVDYLLRWPTSGAIEYLLLSNAAAYQCPRFNRI
jgi:hypothetical protein